jgi:hypothetical protein
MRLCYVDIYGEAHEIVIRYASSGRSYDRREFTRCYEEAYSYPEMPAEWLEP